MAAFTSTALFYCFDCEHERAWLRTIPVAVADDMLGHGRTLLVLVCHLTLHEVEAQRQVLELGQRPHDLHGLLDDLPDLVLLVDHVELAGVDLGQVQDVVDQVQKQVAGRARLPRARIGRGVSLPV